MSSTEKLLDNLKERITTDNRYLYTAGADFTRSDGDGFFIEVPSGGGSVVYTTAGGQTNTETMSAGYHPCKFVKIWAATAINLVITY
jgi:hypothetical protein